MSQPRLAKNRKSLMLAAAVALAGCGSEEPGGVAGELLVGTTNLEEGGDVESIYYLHVPEGEGADPELVFTRNPYLSPGTRLRVWGDRVGTQLHVNRHQVLDEDDLGFGMLRQPIINAAKKPVSAAIAIVDLGGGSPNLTLDQANSRMFSTNTVTDKSMSLKYFYAENSYGIMEVSGKAYGPLQYAMSGCDYNGVAKAIQNMIPEEYDKYVYYFGTKASACAWQGLGGGNSAWLNASISCVVLMQEFGHAVNLPHSSTMKCGTNASFADNPASCTHNEYGGRHSPMGSGCNSMTGWERWRSGWLSGCNGVRVKASGSFTIYPIELPCNGAQVLQIPMAKTRQAPDGLQVTLSHYYLELRAPHGIDTTLKPQVLVYASAEQPVSRSIGDLRAWVLDQTPTDTSRNKEYWGLAAGQTFTDPAGGVSFTVTSVDATQAVIEVNITSTTVPNVSGGNTCIDSTTAFVPGTSECAPTTSRPDGATGSGGAGGMVGTGGSPNGGKGGGGGSGNTGGSAGKSGSGGAGGMAGNAGRGGGGGAAGSGGTSGAPTAGTSNAGSTSIAGSPGTAGTPGSAGSPSSGAGGGIATGGVPSTGGIPGTGGVLTGGTPNVAGASGGPGIGIPPPIDAGCACEVGVGARPSGGAWSFAALALTLGHWLGRRRKRAQRARDPSD